MNLLGAILYDPTTAVSKVTTAAIAMTAIDTTNLRLAITVPAHGKVRFRLSSTLHGATTMPQIMLGVMNGAAIVGRIAPMFGATNIAATSLVKVEADFVSTGLTPGAMNCDAAYGVETLVAATGLKYGGPNNTTANDAFGAFVFEAWDPIPLPTAAPGAANGVQICGANAATTYATLTSTGAFSVNGVSNVSQTGDSFAVVKSGGTGDNAAIKTKTDFLPSATAGASGGVFIAGTNAATTITTGLTTTFTGNLTGSVGSVTGLTASNLDATVSSRLATSGYTAPPTAAAITNAVWDEPIASHLGAGSTGLTLNGAGAAGDPWATALPGAYGAGTAGKIIGDKIIASVTGAVGSVTAGVSLAAGQHVIVDSGTVTTLTNLPSIPANWITAAGISAAAFNGKGDWSTYAGGAVASVTAAVTVGTNNDKTGYSLTQTFPANFSALTIAGTGEISCDVKKINAVTVNGIGTSGSPWGP